MFWLRSCKGKLHKTHESMNLQAFASFTDLPKLINYIVSLGPVEWVLKWGKGGGGGVKRMC